MRNWPLILTALAWLQWPVAAIAFDEELYKEMPAGEAKELVFDQCSSCHSIKLVVGKELSIDGWAAVLKTMWEDQGMMELSAGERGRILDYLARWYGEDRAAAKSGKP